MPLAACQPSPPDENAAATMRLRAYRVPPQQSSALSEALSHALMSRDSGVHVTEAFPGTVLVYAPPETQASISNAIGALTKSAAGDAAVARLQVHFWLLDAVPGAGSSDAALQPLTTTLNRLRGSLGPSHFVLEDAVTATVMSDRKASIATSSNRQYEFSARTAAGGAVDLRLQYNDNHGPQQGLAHLETVVALKPGQYVVLAQAPNAAWHVKTGTPGSATPAMRLLVVRVDSATVGG
ncbi:MAG TPA: hypothetical protein VFG73_07605 [Rhodanobacteraceae bacterium]|nr:hypothetical protein [Rhodanobacteraceae bacterium]